MGNQSVKGFIDGRIPCDNAFLNAVISFEIGKQFLPVYQFTTTNATFVAIIHF
ncbi:hypothetical protein SDC9_156670 [bioreactor metagenome]|uniref:Uncharacterized protein n=1 Tax=bioreactor metagenome TaxID=1076179 RepID=A0A645F528_9ZZZZ